MPIHAVIYGLQPVLRQCANITKNDNSCKSRSKMHMTERNSTRAENKNGQNCQQNIFLPTENDGSSIQNYFPGNELILLNFLMKYRQALKSSLSPSQIIHHHSSESPLVPRLCHRAMLEELCYNKCLKSLLLLQSASITFFPPQDGSCPPITMVLAFRCLSTLVSLTDSG